MLTPIKVFRGVRAIARITLDPTRLEEVFVLADLSEESGQMHKLVAQVKSDPRFPRIFEERPRLGRVDLDELGQLPLGTLGRSYADFMRARGLAHENLRLIVGERDLDWMRNHLRETHDIWHVATGFDTDVAGELGVQAFYLGQFTGPLPLLLLAAGMLNTLVRAVDDTDRRMHAIARGWVLGRRARPLFGMNWAQRWTHPLSEVRRDLGLELEQVDAFLAEKGAADALAAAA